MQRGLTLAALGGAALFLPIPAALSQQVLDARNAISAAAPPAPSIRSTSPVSNLPGLPPGPAGKSTVLGGEIRNVDPVKDQFTLKVFGEKPIKILFDERTQVYRDGKRISLLQLTPSEHASVQTALDHADVFAVSVHILSQSPTGEYQGRVLSYHADTGELTIEAGAAGQPFKLHVSGTTSIARVGQSSFTSGQSNASDLARGSLVSVQFESGKDGRGVASRVDVLATPGSAFIFSGNISALDQHAGYLVLTDPRDDKTYQIFFDSIHTPNIPKLTVGGNLRVATQYDGTHYVATEITSR